MAIRNGILALSCAVSLGVTTAAHAKGPIGTLSVPQSQNQSLSAPTPIYSFNFAVNVPASSPGSGGGGRPQIGDLVIARAVDAASPALWQASLTGMHMATVVVVLMNGGLPVTYTLTDAFISSMLQSQTDSTVALTEEVHFTFSRIQFLFGGSTTTTTAPPPLMTWDVAANAPY
jgi:type VI protein secretion system component Hcp